MITADLVVRECNQLITCSGPITKRTNALRDLGVVKSGCIAATEGQIVFVGSREEEFLLRLKGYTYLQLSKKGMGSLEVGKKMDFVLCATPNYPYLVYHFGINPIKHVIKNGKLVVKDSQLVTNS